MKGLKESPRRSGHPFHHSIRAPSHCRRPTEVSVRRPGPIYDLSRRSDLFFGRTGGRVSGWLAISEIPEPANHIGLVDRAHSRPTCVKRFLSTFWPALGVTKKWLPRSLYSVQKSPLLSITALAIHAPALAAPRPPRTRGGSSVAAGGSTGSVSFAQRAVFAGRRAFHRHNAGADAAA